jgi:hypothetical protein
MVKWTARFRPSPPASGFAQVEAIKWRLRREGLAPFMTVLLMLLANYSNRDARMRAIENPDADS